jgi:hypothetical protein
MQSLQILKEVCLYVFFFRGLKISEDPEQGLSILIRRTAN